MGVLQRIARHTRVGQDLAIILSLSLAAPVLSSGSHVVTTSGVVPEVGPASTHQPVEAHPHDGARCSSCHGRSREAVATSDPSDVCVSCHRGMSRPAEPSPVEPVTSYHGDADRSCTSCHSFHAPSVVRIGGAKEISFADGSIRDHCASCHGPKGGLDELSKGHRIAAALYHGLGEKLTKLSPSEGCLLCHGETHNLRALGVQDEAVAAVLAELPETPRFATHNGHPYGKDAWVVPASDFFRSTMDPRVKLFDGRIECQTCHQMTAATADLLIPFEAPKDLCLQCHTDKQRGPASIAVR